jgi:hypothetical protein
MSKYNIASVGNLPLERVLSELSLSQIPPTEGNVYFVIPSTDTAYTQFVKDNQKIYDDGSARIQTSLSDAYDAAVTNRNDVIVLSAYGAHAITSMLDISKNRIHFVGGGFRAGSMGMGARARVTMGDSTVSADIALMKNTGVGNTFHNIKFDSSSTVAASLYCVAEGGEYTIYDGCEFYKSTDLDENVAAEVLNNGDSVQWLNCVFGSTVNASVGAVIRPEMLLTRETITGKVCRDNIIDNCLFLSKAGNAAKTDIYGGSAGGNDVERMLLIKDTVFLSNILAAATPDDAISFAAAQTQGTVLLKNCTSVDHTVMKTASLAIYVDGAVPTQNTSGVAVTG